MKRLLTAAGLLVASSLAVAEAPEAGNSDGCSFNFFVHAGCMARNHQRFQLVRRRNFPALDQIHRIAFVQSQIFSHCRAIINQHIGFRLPVFPKLEQRCSRIHFQSPFIQQNIHHSPFNHKNEC